MNPGQLKIVNCVKRGGAVCVYIYGPFRYELIDSEGYNEKAAPMVTREEFMEVLENTEIVEADHDERSIWYGTKE